MTQWIKDDTNMIPNDLTTELPDTTTDSDIKINDISGIVSPIDICLYIKVLMNFACTMVKNNHKSTFCFRSSP